MSRTTSIDKYFRIFGLESSSSFAQVKEARAWYTKAFHPDRFPKDSKDAVKAEEKQKEINLAFEELQKWFHSGDRSNQAAYRQNSNSEANHSPKNWQTQHNVYIQELIEFGSSPSTVKNFISDTRKFFAWYLAVYGANTDLYQTDLEDMVTTYAYDLSELGYSPSTIARHLYSLKGFLTFIGFDATFIILLAREIKSEVVRRTDSLTDKQLIKFLKVLETYAWEREEALIRFILHTGVSVSELCALTWQDVSFVKVAGRKQQCIMRVNGRMQDRSIPLNELAIVSLKVVGLDHMLRKKGKYLKVKIFCGDDQEMTPKMVHYMIDRYAKIASVKVTPSILRNTFCKKLARSGVPLHQLAALIGVTEQSAKVYYQTSPTIDELVTAVNRA